MAKFTFMVLSNPVPGQEAEYNDWYSNRHIHDVARARAITAARRYQAEPMSDKAAAKLGYQYLALYEAEANTADEVGAGIAGLAERGGMPMSDALDRGLCAVYFEEIAAVGDAPAPSPDRRLMIVLSNPKDGQEDAFNTWYTEQHIHDVVKVPGVVRARRFRAAPASAGAAAKLGYRYAAVYDLVADDPAKVAQGLGAAVQAGKMPMSDSFDPALGALIYYREIAATD